MRALGTRAANGEHEARTGCSSTLMWKLPTTTLADEGEATQGRARLRTGEPGCEVRVLCTADGFL